MIPENDFDNEGFTITGKERFGKTLESYENTLFIKSLAFADAHKEADLSREVTHEHVRQAADSIKTSSQRKPKSTWAVLGQALEYLCSAGIAFGLAKIDTSWGGLVAVFSLVIGAVLLIVRVVSSK